MNVGLWPESCRLWARYFDSQHQPPHRIPCCVLPGQSKVIQNGRGIYFFIVTVQSLQLEPRIVRGHLKRTQMEQEEQPQPMLITAPDVGKLLKISRPTVQRLARAGVIPAPVISSGRVQRWSTESIASFARGERHGNT